MQIAIFLSLALIFFIPPCSNAADKPSLLSLLKAGEFEHLESATRELQQRFETGAASEIELHNTYKQFYTLNRDALANLDEWKSRIPDSYAAHLIRGAYYRRIAGDLRGGKYTNETPKENLEAMHRYFDLAEVDLAKSLQLTEKPFLSVLHLLNITMHRGTKHQSHALFLAGERILPHNTLIRNRYFTTLEPRWGGSYDEMHDFINQSINEGISKVGLYQLTAIMFEDMGKVLSTSGDHQRAVIFLTRALELGQRAGAQFRKHYLQFSNLQACRQPSLEQYCDLALLN
jgi:hypothetical protein